MMTSRKDYRAVADAFKAEVEKTAGDTYCDAAVKQALLNVAMTVADTFRADNPRFDWAKFMAACKF
jgi:hypothetical protein